MRTRLLTGVLVSVLATGCSLITANELNECETSADCATDQVCTQNLCLPLPTGCGKVYGNPDPTAIQLGALFPIHTSIDPGASVDESDEQASNAVQLALDQLNLRNFNGRQFALNVCDTSGNSDRAKKQADWLVKEKKVPAIITAGSGQTLGVAQSVTIPNNVLVLSYSASSSELTALPDKNNGPVGLVWRTAPSDAIQGSVIARLLLMDDRFGKPKRVGILYVDDPYGQGLYNTISTQLSTGTGIPNKGFAYTRQGDVKAALDALNTYDPDLTVLMAFADDAKAILREAATRDNLKRTSPISHRWFFSDSVKDVTVLADTVVSAQAQDSYGTAPAQGAGPAFKTFQESFQGKFFKDPSEYAYTSNAYDAMYLLALSAIYSQGTSGSVTGAKMAEGLTKMSTGTSSTNTQLVSSNFTPLAAKMAAGEAINVEGASGHLDFNEAGEAPAPMELWQVRGDRFLSIESAIEPPQ